MKEDFQLGYGTLAVTMPAGGSATGTKVGLHTFSPKVFHVNDQGALGNGIADDRAAVQAAIDLAAVAGGVVLFAPDSTYLIASGAGATDQYGLKIAGSGVTLDLQGSTLRRSVAGAYALIFIGTPGSDATLVTDVVVRNGVFIGNSLFHALSGQQPDDYRTMIQIRNASDILITGNRFEAVDSSAIFTMSPDGTSTKHVTRLSIISNSFVAASHAVVGRALIHAVACSGVDGLIVAENHFAWCDDAVSGGGSFAALTDADGSTFSHASLGTVERCGRGWVIHANQIYNSSEHALYIGGMDVAITGNVVWNDTPTICTSSDVKTFGTAITIVGNKISAGNSGIVVGEGSDDITIASNVLHMMTVGAGATIQVQMNGISAFVAARPWLTYYPLRNLTITGNAFRYVGTAPTSVSDATIATAIRIFTSTTDVNYASAGLEYQIESVVINGNTFHGYSHPLRLLGLLLSNLTVANNVFRGGALPVTESAFAGASTLISKAVISCNNAACLQLRGIFTGNMVYGFAALWGRTPDTGALSNAYPPMIFSSNYISYCNAIDNGEYRAYTDADLFLAEGNTGTKFYATKPTAGSASAWQQTTGAQANAGRVLRSTSAVSVYDAAGVGRLPFAAIAVATLTADSIAPSVQDKRVCLTANTVPTAIDNFSLGRAGQEIVVIVGDANTTFDFSSSNLKGNAGVNVTAGVGDALYCTYDGTNWHCTVSKAA